MKIAPWFIIVVLAAALAGCSSSVRPRGDIHLGDMPETVESAMDRPGRTLSRAGDGGHETVWIYTRYREKRLEATGWSEVLVPGAQDQNGKVTRQPVTREVRRKEMNRDMHVIFINGRVSYIEYQTR